MATNVMSIMDTVEEYTRRWIKSLGEERDIFSECIKSIRHSLKTCIRYLPVKMRTIYPSVFTCKKPEVIDDFCRLHNNFELVPADKASNNNV
jgi:hypothetical protein